MRFWIIFWSAVLAFVSLQTYSAIKAQSEWLILLATTVFLSVYMWLYTFVQIIIMDFAPILIELFKGKKLTVESKNEE